MTSVLALTPGDHGAEAYTPVLGTYGGTLPNSMGVEREELRPRQGSDVCSSMV